MEKLTLLDLFSGGGGFTKGLEDTGHFRTVAFCEAAPRAQEVLKKNYPGVPIYDDIHTIRTEYTGPAIDAISGGFPCQPFTYAGLRRGRADDRDLWPEMLKCVDYFKPSLVLGENVVGIGSMAITRRLSKVESRTYTRYPDRDYFSGLYTYEENLYLAQVCKDLESLGYAVIVFEIPALGVGAHQVRPRFYIVAYALRPRGKARLPAPPGGQERGSSFPFDAGGRGRRGPRCRDWSVEPELGRVADGIPGRVDRLGILGNAIHPEIAFRIGDAFGTLTRWGRLQHEFSAIGETLTKAGART